MATYVNLAGCKTNSSVYNAVSAPGRDIAVFLDFWTNGSQPSGQLWRHRRHTRKHVPLTHSMRARVAVSGAVHAALDDDDARAAHRVCVGPALDARPQELRAARRRGAVPPVAAARRARRARGGRRAAQTGRRGAQPALPRRLPPGPARAEADQPGRVGGAAARERGPRRPLTPRAPRREIDRTRTSSTGTRSRRSAARPARSSSAATTTSRRSAASITCEECSRTRSATFRWWPPG